MATKVKKRPAAKRTSKKEVERVKTWRVLRDGLRQGDSIRNFGDFLPEAPTLPTIGTLLRTNIIEEVWVDQEEFDAWEKDQAERDAALVDGNPVIVEEDFDEDLDSDDEDEEIEESRPAPAKTVAKKTAAKKTAKKTVAKKKGKSSGEAAQGKRLSAESV